MMHSPGFDADLLQPSLSQHDDRGDFNRPWNPSRIMLPAFFFGLTAAGILFGWNYERLGRPHKKWPTVIVFLLLNMLLVGGVTYGFAAGWWTHDDGRNLRLGGRVITVFLALGAARSQSDRYRLAKMTDAPLGSLWIPGTIAGLIGIGVQLALAMLFAELFFPQARPALP